jgi:hypothetical protein
MADERRRSPRVEMLGRLSGQSLSLDGPLKVVEMSLGGMAVETSFEMTVGSRREFRLTLGDGAIVQLVGRVRHSRRALMSAEPALYISGIEFVDEEPSDMDVVPGLLSRWR